MEFRKIFDTIPDEFDRWRCRYSAELFTRMIEAAHIGPGTSVLELGPGTGQATDPILATGCDYHAIELGEHLYLKCLGKYGSFPNYHIVNGDFITHDFGGQQFDVIYSAATIQWIPEDIAYRKTFALLKPGGYLVMMRQRGEYRSPNEDLYQKIQEIYRQYFKPSEEYTHHGFDYAGGLRYGYTDLQQFEFYGQRVFTGAEYAAYSHTHCDHLVIPEPYRTPFFEGLQRVIEESGDRLVANETYLLNIVRKPL